MENHTSRRIILITGGARSGKSSFALKLAETYDNPVFVATAQAGDEEMAERIRNHQSERGDHWKTVEVSTEVVPAIHNHARKNNVVIVDCLTLLLSNLMEAEEEIPETIASLCDCLKGSDSCIILVTNELGMGIVPASKMARQFRDLQGNMNKQIAAVADEVYLMSCGLPLRMK